MMNGSIYGHISHSEPTVSLSSFVCTILPTVDTNPFPLRVGRSRLGGAISLRSTGRTRGRLRGRWNWSKVVPAHIHRVLEGLIRVLFTELAKHPSHQHSHLLHHSHHLLLKHLLHVHIKSVIVLLPLLSIPHVKLIVIVVILLQFIPKSVSYHHVAKTPIIRNLPSLNFHLHITRLPLHHRTPSRTNAEDLLDFLATHLSVDGAALRISTENRKHFF